MSSISLECSITIQNNFYLLTLDGNESDRRSHETKLETEMLDEPGLEKWNFQVLMLGQALIGAIFANFRMVALRWGEDE